MASATYTGQQSGLYNDQLAPIFSGFQFNPPSSLQPVVGMGAGPNTLPTAGTAAAATQGGAASSSPTTGGGTASGPFGIPSVLLWIVAGFLIGYVLLWKVNYRK